MNNEINEQLSALMDGELAAEELEAVLQAFKVEEQVRGQWANYHLIRDSLQGHLPEISLCDLAREVSQALEQEPTLLVAVPPEAEVAQRLSQRWKYAAGLALAASLSAVTVLGIQSLAGRGTASESSLAVAGPTISPGAEVVPALDSQHWAVLEPEVKERLNTYLVNHTEYVDNMPGMLRYGRIVSYESSR